VRSIALLALAAAGYVLAAWMVAPGFYDGIGPVAPYNWESPPPEFANSNLPPKSGHLVIKVINGISNPDSAFTSDGQIVIGFLPGAFAAGGATTVTVDITPVATFPASSTFHFATNVYLVTSSVPMVTPKGGCNTGSGNSDPSCINVTLRYSNGIPQPSDLYTAPSASAEWKSLGATQQSQVFTINATAQSLGYFAAGYPTAAKPGSVTIGGSALPIIVAAAIVLVILAGVPIAVMRRRRAASSDDEDEPEPPAKSRT